MSVSFGGKVLPTKLELIRINRSLRVSLTVHKILDDKREILLRRMDELIGEAIKAREEIRQPLADAYRSLYNAYFKVGPVKLESIALTTPVNTEVDVDVRTIVDVKVPTLEVRSKEVGLTYGFMDTSSDLDRATKMMRSVIPYICKAAEIENAIFGLAKELERTQRLLNALEYIIIPQYEENIKFIRSTLDEREREDFARLKHIKRLMEIRKASVSGG